MNRFDRIKRLEEIAHEIDIIALDYVPDWPMHKMAVTAMGFLNSMLILETNESELDRRKFGILVHKEDADPHRRLVVEDGKVMALE